MHHSQWLNLLSLCTNWLNRDSKQGTCSLFFFFLHSCVLSWRPLPFCLGCYAIRPGKSVKPKQSNPPQSLRPDWGIDMCCLLPTQRTRRFITVSSWSNATVWQCLWFNEVTFYLASYHQGIACHWEVSDAWAFGSADIMRLRSGAAKELMFTLSNQFNPVNFSFFFNHESSRLELYVKRKPHALCS